MNEFFTWEHLATYAGTILAVTLITQFIKGLKFLNKVPTRCTSYVIALALMLATQAFTTGLSWSTGVLTIVNAVVVSLAANGAFDALNDNRSSEDDHPPDDEKVTISGFVTDEDE